MTRPTSRTTRTARRARTHARRSRLFSLIAAIALVAAACGGGGDDDDATTGTTLVGAAETDSEGDGSAASNGGLSTGGAAPDSIDFGETYSITVPETVGTTETIALSIPAGSVTTATVEGAPTNTSAVSIVANDGSLFWLAEPGGSTETDPVITSNEEGLDVRLEVTGVPGDVVQITVENALQSELADGGDAPPIITDAPSVDGSISGLLGGADTEDVFRYTASPGDVLSATVSAPGDSTGSVNLSWEYNGERKASASAAAGGQEEAIVVLNGEQGGDWYLRVTGSGTYSLAVSATSQNEAGSGTDAGGDIATAVPAEPGTITGQLGGDDDGDFYAIELPAGAVVTMGLAVSADSPGGVNIRLLEQGSEIDRVSAQPGGSDEVTMTLANDAGTGHLELWGADSSYEITLTVGAQADGGSPGDAGDDAAQAVAVEAPGSFTGAMSSEDTADFFSFVSPGDVSVTMSAETATRNFNFRLLVDGSEIDREVAGPGATNTIEAEIPAGTVVIIELWSGRGDYEFVIE